MKRLLLSSALTVSRDGPVLSFGVSGQGVGSEPLAAPGPPHAPTLPLLGRPHARSGTPTQALFRLLLSREASPECRVVFAAAPRIHAGLGPRHSGAGGLLPRLAGSHHPAAEQGTGTQALCPE